MHRRTVSWKLMGRSTLLLFSVVLLPWLSSVTSHNRIGSSLTNRGRRDRDVLHNVYVAGFFPVSEGIPEGAIGRGCLPAVQLAMQHINDNGHILPDYHLKIMYNDTSCDAAVGLKAFFDMVHRLPLKVLLFGAACTQVTDPIAKTSLFWHLNQLSYADTHPMFTSDKYPNLFRVVPSESGFNPPRIELLKRFNWSWVGTLYQKDPRYALAHNKLLSELEVAKIKISETQSIADEARPALQKLKEKDVRIILGNFNEFWARRIFCEAYRLGMYGRKYQWIIVGMYRDEWWTNHATDQLSACSTDQLEQALDGCLTTDLLPLRANNVRTISGLTADGYLRLYNSKRLREYSRFHGYAYDGMWTMALAIDKVARNLAERSVRGRADRTKTRLSLEDFQYRDQEWGRIFRQALQDTDFEGVTGPVKFIDNDRRGYILVKQFQGNREVTVGVYDGITEILDLNLGQPIVWKGNGPPAARVLYVIKQRRVNVTVYSAFATVASIGIVVSLIFLTINVKHRNQRFIKMSSPYLNNLIIIGCVLTYTSVILLGLDSALTSPESLPFVCTARAWVLMSGFTLAFGSMFSKTWRVHTIFTNIKLNKKAITDYQLFAVVGVLLGLDIAIMTTWQCIDPFYRHTEQLKPVPSLESEDIYVIPEVEYCRSHKMTYFLGAIYLYKGLLMVIGCFLAWETRHVSIPALNDSKYVGMSVYNVVIMCVMGAAISSILTEQQNAAFILISIFIVFCTSTTLCLVFVPKLIELQRNPKGTETRIRSALQPSMKTRCDSDGAGSSGRSVGDDNGVDTIRLLQEQNLQYKRTLKERDLQLRALMRQLGDDANDIVVNDVHFKMRFPRIVEILRIEGGSVTDEDDETSVISMNSSQDGEASLLAGEILMSRSSNRRASTDSSIPPSPPCPPSTARQPPSSPPIGRQWAADGLSLSDKSASPFSRKASTKLRAAAINQRVDSVALIEFSPIMRKSDGVKVSGRGKKTCKFRLLPSVITASTSILSSPVDVIPPPVNLSSIMSPLSSSSSTSSSSSASGSPTSDYGVIATSAADQLLHQEDE